MVVVPWCVCLLNGMVIRMTVLIVTGVIKGKLQHPQWWPGQSSWQPLCLCVLTRFNSQPERTNRKSFWSQSVSMLICIMSQNWAIMLPASCQLWHLTACLVQWLMWVAMLKFEWSCDSQAVEQMAFLSINSLKTLALITAQHFQQAKHRLGSCFIYTHVTFIAGCTIKSNLTKLYISL